MREPVQVETQPLLKARPITRSRHRSPFVNRNLLANFNSLIEFVAVFHSNIAFRMAHGAPRKGAQLVPQRRSIHFSEHLHFFEGAHLSIFEGAKVLTVLMVGTLRRREHLRHTR